MSVTIIVAMAALAMWLGILVRAILDRVDLTTIGLIIVVVGLSSAVVLASMDVEAPGVWAYLLSGVLFMALWGRHRPRPVE